MPIHPAGPDRADVPNPFDPANQVLNAMRPHLERAAKTPEAWRQAVTDAFEDPAVLEAAKHFPHPGVSPSDDQAMAAFLNELKERYQQTPPGALGFDVTDPNTP